MKIEVDFLSSSEIGTGSVNHFRLSSGKSYNQIVNTTGKSCLFMVPRKLKM